MLRHRRTRMTVVAAVLAGLGGGVAVAASSHTLPTGAGGGQTRSPAATSRSSTTPTVTTTAKTRASATPTTPNGRGPDATGPAKFGLCTAFSSGRGTTNGGKADSVAFEALATAAGGANNIAAFCADATPGGGHTPPPSSAAPGAKNGPAAEHANPASDEPGPGSATGSQGQSHRR